MHVSLLLWIYPFVEDLIQITRAMFFCKRLQKFRGGDAPRQFLSVIFEEFLENRIADFFLQGNQKQRSASVDNWTVGSLFVCSYRQTNGNLCMFNTLPAPFQRGVKTLFATGTILICEIFEGEKL